MNPLSLPARIAAGVATVALIALGIMLALEKIGHANTRTDLADMTRLRGEERAAHQQTKDNFTGAMAEAGRMQAERVRIVLTEQTRINEEITRDYQERIAAARAAADRLRRERDAVAAASGDPGGGTMPASGQAAGSAGAAPAQGGLPLDDALIATEQAIQLDALIDWALAQGAVDPNSPLR